MTEQAIIREIMLAVTKAGGRLWRNNVGQLQDINGRWVQFGVCNPGGSDLIGFTADGRFLAVEVKAGKTPTTGPQERFIEAVNKAGGVGVIARSVGDVMEALSYGTTEPCPHCPTIGRIPTKNPPQR
jgi:hypothetical protein